MSSPIRILYVEDDQGDAKMAQHVLSKSRRAAFIVDTADTPELAMQKLNDGKYDVIMLDYQLSDGITGLGLMSDIRQEGNMTPIVMCTGFGDKALQTEALSKGAADFVVKQNLKTSSLDLVLISAFNNANGESDGSNGQHSAAASMIGELVSLTAKSLAAQEGLRHDVSNLSRQFNTMSISMEKNTDMIMKQMKKSKKSKIIQILDWIQIHPKTSVGLGVAMAFISLLAVVVSQTINTTAVNSLVP